MSCKRWFFARRDEPKLELESPSRERVVDTEAKKKRRNSPSWIPSQIYPTLSPQYEIALPLEASSSGGNAVETNEIRRGRGSNKSILHLLAPTSFYELLFPRRSAWSPPSILTLNPRPAARSRF